MDKHNELAEEIIRELRERAEDDRELQRRYGNRAYIDLLCLAGYARRFVRASGLELIDDQGDRYLDFVGGHGALSLGHNHPAIRAVLAEMLDAGVPGASHVDPSLLEGLAARELAEALPGDLQSVFFCNSASEAVEAALKLARAATGHERFVCCEGASHGSTLGALSLNGNPALRDRFGPLLPGIERIPYDDLPALERALDGGDVAAFVVEPILGEGGAVNPRYGYLRGALELCRTHKALLVVDEAQTGLGRTGKLMAVQQEGIAPDAVVVGTGLGGGMLPVAAMVAREEPFTRAYGKMQTCQSHGTTFGAGPLAMAAVIATLRTLRTEGLIENAARQGDHLRRRLLELKQRRRLIAEIEGRGLMIGIKLEDLTGGLLERTPLRKVGETSELLLAQSVSLRLLEEHHVVTQTAANAPGVLKLTPPLMVTREQIDRFVDGLDHVLAESSHTGAIGHLAGKILKNAF
jgi:putrescine aminotransferase